MSRFIGVLLLGAAAYLTNLFPVQLSFGLHFLFGGLFAMLAAILFGPWAGAAAAAIGALPTIELWGHPFAVLSMTLEAWVVGFEARSGGLHHTQTDLLYWLLLGGPLVVVTYTFGAHIPLLATFVAALKQAANGLALTSVASVLALAVAWRRRQRPLPLEVFLSGLMTFLVLLPLVLSLNVTVRDSGAHLREQVRGEAIRAGEVVQASLVRELGDQRRMLGMLAHAAEDRSLAELPAGLKALWLLPGEGGAGHAEEGVLFQRGGHQVIDFGDDVYTRGRAHPMIDPRIRTERLLAAGRDPSTAVILLDVVLGYGSHEDPAGVVAEAVETLRREGRQVAVVASVCGTDGDPQGYTAQRRKLEEVGVHVAPSNADAAVWAAKIVRGEV